MIMNQTNIVNTAYWTVYNMLMSYEKHDMTIWHSGICTQAMMPCLDMMGGGNAMNTD